VSCAAYLRIYVPWTGGPVQRATAAAGGGRRVLVRGEFGVWNEPARNDAFLLEWRGRRYVCPRHPRLRMLEGLLAFHNAYPEPAGPALVPQMVAERAADELGRIHALSPGARSHILTSPFYVPLRWFAAFDPSERLLERDGSGALGIRYLTRRGAALDRLRRAVEILESAGFDEGIVSETGGVSRWMDPFPEDSVVELDYGGVTALFGEGELATDESAAEVADSLSALETGDLHEAGGRYAAVASRWAHAQSLTYAN
jgi:hypothetical protein